MDRVLDDVAGTDGQQFGVAWTGTDEKYTSVSEGITGRGHRGLSR